MCAPRELGTEVQHLHSLRSMRGLALVVVRRINCHGCSLQHMPLGDAREQFAACEALLNDGAVDACAAAAET